MFCYFLLTHKTIFIIHNVTLIMRLNINQVVVVYPFPESVINSAFLRVCRPAVFQIPERTRENWGDHHRSGHKKIARPCQPRERSFQLLNRQQQLFIFGQSGVAITGCWSNTFWAVLFHVRIKQKSRFLFLHHCLGIHGSQ
ncbi:hypothetical protein EYY78_20750 [Escherichia coli]|nr:hypothetical protein EYY78_20750 [Escherichia coli]